MSIKFLSWLLAIGLLLAAAWHFRDSPYVDTAIRGLRQATAPSLSGKDMRPAETTRAGASAAKTSSALRKCVSGSKVLYTDGSCPAGSTEQSVGKGTVTVVAGQQAPGTATAEKSGSVPTARDIAASPNKSDIGEKRMERIIGK